MNQSKSKFEISIEQEDSSIKLENTILGINELEVNKSEIIENNLHSKKKLTNNANSTQAIKTFCRIRPCDGKNDIFKAKENSDDKTLLVNCDPQMLKKLSTVPTFTFSKVFDENSTQTEVFERTCQILVEDLIKKRKPGLIFTYGMTNAGKTFTVIGSPTSPGILPQSLKYLYDKVENNVDGEGDFSVDCNFVEIYNEEVYDLLANSTDPKNKFYKKKINIKENNKKLFFLHDVTYQKIANLEDFNNALSKGILKKVHAATNLNQNSSRSHTIFKIILKPNNQDEEEVSLSIVDLAGSERANRTEAQGKELQEACKINQSLSVLGKCMEALRFNSIYTNKKLVPFRESKLTMLFQEYFQGDQNVIMVTNINPRREDFEETIRALNYSCIAKEIKPIKSKIVVNPIRKQVKISNSISNTDINAKENEVMGIDKESFNLDTASISKSNSVFKVNSRSSNEVNFLKSELEKLKEEFLKFKYSNNAQGTQLMNCNNNMTNEFQINPYQSSHNSNQMMQMMNNTQSLMLNDNSNPHSLFYPSYFPFMWPPNHLSNQLMSHSNLNNINHVSPNNPPSQMLDLEFIPPNLNSFNLVFINSKFNDIHMGPKKKVNKNSRKNKKDSSLQLIEENRLHVEIKEIIPEEVQNLEEMEETGAVQNNSAVEADSNNNFDLDLSLENEIKEENIEICENIDSNLTINEVLVEEDIVDHVEEKVEIVKKADNVKKAKKKKKKKEDREGEGEKKEEEKEVKKKKKKPKKKIEEEKIKDRNSKKVIDQFVDPINEENDLEKENVLPEKSDSIKAESQNISNLFLENQL